MENRYDIPQSNYVYYRVECFTGTEYIFRTIKCNKSKVNQITLHFLPDKFETLSLTKTNGFIMLTKDLIKDLNPDEKYYKNGGKYIVPLENYFDDVLIID